MTTMRETGSGWAVQHSSRAWMRALRLGAATLAIALVASSGAMAQDDEEEDLSFDQKVIKQIMTGLGGTNMENTGIDYRERSPLVVPPKITLPPPDTAASTASVPNWPKDPDVAARKRAIEDAKRPTGNPLEWGRSLTPREMAAQRSKPKVPQDTNIPGDPNRNIVLSPSQLGVSSGMFKNMFGGNTGETAEFKGEPSRESLTQPPPGYQTPSSEYAYGTGPKEVLRNSSQVNPMTGKY